jgi:NAD+ dependent glucose-6-phosphate dehydrogenase
MQVGITGGAGRIGTALVEGLSDKYTFTLFDIREMPQSSSGGLKSLRVDLSRAEDVAGIFNGLDAIIHLAANPSPQAPWENVLSNNIMATYNVYEEAHRAGVSKIVFASTNHVQHGYTMAESPSTEDLSYVKSKGLIKASDPPAPDSLYGVSKLFGEDLGRYYARLFGIQFVALRIGWAVPDVIPKNVIEGEKSLRDHFLVMFVSRRDLVEAFDRALQVNTDCLVAYAVGDNRTCVFDLTDTRESLGFNPRDNSEDFFKGTGSIS